MNSIYTNREYLQKNPTWHDEDSPWKASQVVRLLARNKLVLATVAEIGCGAGGVLASLAENLPPQARLHGFDISPQAIEMPQKRQRPGLTYSCEDALTSPDTFDLFLVIDVIEQEATRDLYAAGAVQAGDEDDYFQSNLFSVARRRVVWLLVLLLANSGTAAVIASMDAVLKQVVVLAAFIPLLIGTGGNVGAQSSTVVIRGLSTQRIQALGAGRAIWREAVAGALLGLLMMLVVIPWSAYVSGGNWVVAAAAGFSLVAITTLAATAGAALPLLFNRLGLDPALMSAPFIATATDVAGVFIYLQTASWLLSRSGG